MSSSAGGSARARSVDRVVAEELTPDFRYPEASRETEMSRRSGGVEFGERSGEESRALAEAAREGEARARAWYAEELERGRARLGQALEEFARERAAYFLAVEREAVQLTLRIAGKVLEREARADPLAVAAMVHVALASLHGGTSVTLRVHPAGAQDWRLYFAARSGVAGDGPSIQEDANLTPGECVLETAMGTAEVSLDQKLREIEVSFLELLAQRPGSSR